ncbi:MAG: AAA family ATPase, partial [Pyrinomonadaceae bacterium]
MPTTPFSVSPNPAALFLTPSLRSALHKVRYTVENRQGLTCVLGDAGMGKSSLMRLLHLEYEGRPEEISVAYITDPDFHTPNAFVRSICQSFDVPMRRSFQAQKDEFKEYILGQAGVGKNVVLLLDEAQGMTPDTMEILRSFLNFESNTAKLLQVVMAGQLDLRERLKLSRNRALRSRIVMYSLMSALSPAEAKGMLEHRCQLADIPLPFSDEVIDIIYSAAGGTPRDILRICGYAYEISQVGGDPEV